MLRPDSFPTLDRFIGRTAELTALQHIYTTFESAAGAPPRLVTLTGIGGTGKTRLAQELVQRVKTEFADGAVWIDLAPLSDPALITRTFLAAFDLSETADHTTEAVLVAHLEPRQLLLVLDNCEHLLAACAALAAFLLFRCPELCILATSRAPLGVSGEINYRVPPLPLPDENVPDSLLTSDSVTLFQTRARQVLPEFALTEINILAVARICRQLDGLPLAIELAAARVNMLTVNEIADRLDDAIHFLTRSAAHGVARHQTLRAAMDWSYALLSPAEQVLLRRVSVFANEFTLDAAEYVCADETVSRTAILDLVSNLVDKSLVHIAQRSQDAPTRYRLLETVKQYAHTKLVAADETDQMRAQHLAWYITFAERAAPGLTGSTQGHWLLRLDQEQFNLRAALRYALDSHNQSQGLVLANSLWRYWDRRGSYFEALTWYQRLLGINPAAPLPTVSADLAHTDARTRAQALYGLAVFHFRLGELERAMPVGEAALGVMQRLQDRPAMALTLNLLGAIAAEQADLPRAHEFHSRALALRRELGDTWGVGTSLYNLGFIAYQQGIYQRSFEYARESLEIKRALGDAVSVALTLNLMGDSATSLGDYDRARELLESSLELHRQFGDKQGIVYNLTNLADLAFNLGEDDRALALYQEAEPLAQQLGSKGDIAIVLSGLAELAQVQGETARAQTLYEQALVLFRQAGEQLGIGQMLYGLARIALSAGDVARAADLQLSALRLFRKLAHKPALARSLEGLAFICLARQQDAIAAQCLGAAAHLREETATPPFPSEQQPLEQVRRAAYTALGARRFDDAFQRGRMLPTDETLSFVLTLAPERVELSVQEVAPTAPQIFGLGQSLVVRQGGPITSAEWTYTKAKELFFYLLSNPRASKPQIGLDLWADASPAQLRSIFHRVLHALRKALGTGDWITFQDNAYLLALADGYVYDLEAFQTLLADARRFLRDDAAPQALAAMEQAVALYQGDFLPDLIGGDWIIIRREQIRQEFLQALLTLGHLYTGQKQYAVAAQTYERALAHDNYLEIAHRELIRARARQGDVAFALKQYQILVELLHAEFGAPPAPETRALYDRLSRGERV